MRFIDIMIIIILMICVSTALFSIKKNQCQDCTHCHKNCGGKKDGRKFESTFKNQRK